MKGTSLVLLYILVFCSYIHITGCKTADDNEKVVTPNVAATLQQLYWHTQIVNDVASNEVSVLVQFYENDASKKTVPLPEGVTILLDGQPFQADSSKQGGIFYEITRSLADFTGAHELLMKADASTYSEIFNFPDLPVSTPSVDDAIVSHRNKFVIDIASLSKMDNVRVVITDTAFPGKGFELQVSPATTPITLQPSEIADIKNGPLVIEINGESGKPLTSKYPGKGKIDITAIIRYETILVD